MEKINELLGIADKAVASTKTQTATVIPRPQTNEEDEDDFKYSRENLYHIIERGQDALSGCLLYTSPSPRDGLLSRMPSSA